VSEINADVLVVGAGPAGSSAATYAARAGRQVVLIDSAIFPRDKPCGDGLTPRAIAELNAIGLSDWLSGRARKSCCCLGQVDRFPTMAAQHLAWNLMNKSC